MFGMCAEMGHCSRRVRSPYFTIMILRGALGILNQYRPLYSEGRRNGGRDQFRGQGAFQD